MLAPILLGLAHTWVIGVKALIRARDLIGDGAHIIDVGGESTRPGAKQVGADEEIDRVLPIIEVDQLDAQAVVIDIGHSLPNAPAGVPAPVAVAHVLDDAPVLANGVVGTDLGLRVVEPTDHPLQCAVGRGVNHDRVNIVAVGAPVEVG